MQMYSFKAWDCQTPITIKIGALVQLGYKWNYCKGDCLVLYPTEPMSRSFQPKCLIGLLLAPGPLFSFFRLLSNYLHSSGVTSNAEHGQIRRGSQGEDWHFTVHRMHLETRYEARLFLHTCFHPYRGFALFPPSHYSRGVFFSRAIPCLHILSHSLIPSLNMSAASILRMKVLSTLSKQNSSSYLDLHFFCKERL